MLGRMLIADIRRNKALTATLSLFIMLSALLLAGGLALIAEVLSAIESFYAQAQPFHYMQMVTGPVDQAAIDAFASAHGLVDEWQTLEFLGVDNSAIFYADDPDPRIDSVMEMGFTTQSPHFDFLLDKNNQPASVESGQVMVPIFITEAYGVEVGDALTIADGDFSLRLEVVGWLRDSQMNPSLVSSKRLLVSEADYQLIKANTGELEYLVEFTLLDESRLGEFDADYLAAGLPQGVGVTLPMIKLLNVMDSGLSAAALMLASLMLVAIAAVCLRFTLMATLEDERREIGVMKAIGLQPADISRLYRAKYLLIAAVSSAVGVVLSTFVKTLFASSVSLYMGEGEPGVAGLVLPVAGGLAIFAAAGGYCTLALRRLRKVSVVEALRGSVAGGGTGGRALALHRSGLEVNAFLGLRDVVLRLRSYATPVLVFALSAFLAIVPANFLNTLAAPEFITYTGVGDCDAMVSLRHSPDIGDRYDAMLEQLAADPDITAFSGTVTVNYKIVTADGSLENIQVQQGDFAVFPIPYLEGAAPLGADEIALSLLNARAHDVSVGGEVELLVGGEPVTLKVCGIYQDLTNGGRSAQAHLPYSQSDVLWYSVLLSFAPGVDADAKAAELGGLFAPAKVMDVSAYREQTLAPLIGQFKLAADLLFGLSLAVAALISALFLRLMLARDQSQVVIMKGLGFTSWQVRQQYLVAMGASLLLGLALGTVAAGGLGELVVGALMSGLGASRIDFVVDPLFTFLACPASLLLTVMATTFLSTLVIRHLGNYNIAD